MAAGDGVARLAHVGDRTGLEMIRTLQQNAVAAGNIQVFMECTVIWLLKDGDRVSGAVAYRRPDAVAELGPDDVDFVARRQQASEQIGAARRVVGQVEREDGDLHAAPRASRLT